MSSHRKLQHDVCLKLPVNGPVMLPPVPSCISTYNRYTFEPQVINSFAHRSYPPAWPPSTLFSQLVRSQWSGGTCESAAWRWCSRQICGHPPTCFPRTRWRRARLQAATRIARHCRPLLWRSSSYGPVQNPYW